MNLSKVLNEYKEKFRLYDSFRTSLHTLIGEIIRDNASVISLESRIKSLPAIQNKLRIKQVQSISQISDLVGIRIIVRNRSSLDSIYKRLLKEFLVPEISSENHFTNDPRYHGLHLNIKISEDRAKLTEWVSFSDLQAEIQIKTSFAEAFEEINHLLKYKKGENYHLTVDNSKVDSETERLHEIINKFEKLLEKPDVHEKKEIHKFLDENRFILHPNSAEVWSEVQIGLGTEFQMDFLIREATGDYILVEIENSRHNLFTQSGDFTAPVNHAQRQVEDWQDWIEDNISTMQKTYPDIISPEGLVIIGRSKKLLSTLQNRLRRRNINLRGRMKIITYDELIVRARNYVESIRKDLQN